MADGYGLFDNSEILFFILVFLFLFWGFGGYGYGYPKK
ncbi:MAG: hypothetical protein PWR27_154 [Petroclostridium sp.]|jgi:hypothetical protein|nr:hypothetical protein [Clostridia bacterium]MDK2809445.1 hypothetical protein [Petroclostridium sp.]